MNDPYTTECLTVADPYIPHWLRKENPVTDTQTPVFELIRVEPSP